MAANFRTFALVNKYCGTAPLYREGHTPQTQSIEIDCTKIRLKIVGYEAILTKLIKSESSCRNDGIRYEDSFCMKIQQMYCFFFLSFMFIKLTHRVLIFFSFLYVIFSLGNIALGRFNVSSAYPGTVIKSGRNRVQ